jgi:hypothetical protein
VNRQRIHATASTEFFTKFVLRYPDKQYQTWLGGDVARIGIDFDYDSTLLDKISAGIVSHFGRYSLPSALKIVKESPQEHPSRIEQVFDSVESHLHSTSLNFLMATRPDTIGEEHNGVIHAEIFLLRLLSSFIAARRLINWGYLCEPLAILRSSLEQLAWAYAVGVNFDSKQLDNPNPPKCVGILKVRFPAAGRLYGALSRFSHMDFEGQKHFVLSSANLDSHAGVMVQSIEFKFFGLLFYSFLLVAYQFVCRDISKFYLEKYGLRFHLANVVLPLRYLVGHALMQTELDRDEIAATLSEIYLDIFPTRTGSA